MKSIKSTTAKSLLLWILVAIGLSTFSTTAKFRTISGIAAKANGRVVTTNEVAFMLAPRRAELAARYPRRGSTYYSELKKSKKKILDELINQQLIIHEFKAMGANIPDHVVNQQVKKHIRDNFNGSESAFRKQLKSNGLSYTKFVKLTKDKLIGQAMRSQHFNDATPATPSEIRTEYNKHIEKLRDRSKDRIDFEKIYIPKENPDDLLADKESQLKLAESLIKRIKKGENFASLAKEFSKDAFAEQGGKQRNKKRTDLSPGISNILFSERVGAVVGPLEEATGYHIIRVSRKIKGPPVPLSKVKEAIERQVQNEKSSSRFNRYMDRIRKKAIIRYY